MTASRLRTAEIIAVGSELLGSARLDTNSLFLADRLGTLGIDLRIKAVVGDDRSELAVVCRGALARTHVLILTGGLGPTDDDLTRETVSEVLGLPLEEHADILASLRQRFARRGVTMPEVNRKQAMVPRGASVLENPNGSAPGLLIEQGGQVVILLPGPPRELQPMMDRLVAGPLARLAGSERLFRASLFVAGRGESDVEQRIQPIYSAWRDETRPITTTILAAPGQVDVHLVVRDDDPARGADRVRTARQALEAVLGIDVFSTDGRSLEHAVGDLLRERGYRIAIAESCTGGLLTARLTDVPGSSAYVHSGVVAYDNAAKVDLLDVPSDLIARHGSVSEPVALAMAEGVRARSGADVAVSITGIAGPDGGTPDKPVGTVVIVVLVPGRPAFVRTHTFPGGRAFVRQSATQSALDRIRRLLLA